MVIAQLYSRAHGLIPGLSWTLENNRAAISQQPIESLAEDLDEFALNGVAENDGELYHLARAQIDLAIRWYDVHVLGNASLRDHTVEFVRSAAQPKEETRKEIGESLRGILEKVLLCAYQSFLCIYRTFQWLFAFCLCRHRNHSTNESECADSSPQVTSSPTVPFTSESHSSAPTLLPAAVDLHPTAQPSFSLSASYSPLSLGTSVPTLLPAAAAQPSPISVPGPSDAAPSFATTISFPPPPVPVAIAPVRIDNSPGASSLIQPLAASGRVSSPRLPAYAWRGPESSAAVSNVASLPHLSHPCELVEKREALPQLKPHTKQGSGVFSGKLDLSADQFCSLTPYMIFNLIQNTWELIESNQSLGNDLQTGDFMKGIIGSSVLMRRTNPSDFIEISNVWAHHFPDFRLYSLTGEDPLPTHISGLFYTEYQKILVRLIEESKKTPKKMLAAVIEKGAFHVFGILIDNRDIMDEHNQPIGRRFYLFERLEGVVGATIEVGIHRDLVYDCMTKKHPYDSDQGPRGDGNRITIYPFVL